MLALPELQRLFLAALLDRERSAALLPLLRQGRAPGVAQRIQIYRNNLFESLSDALRAVFPALAQLVGEDFFRQLTRRFIRAHPLRQAQLHDFGRELPAWLASLPMAADWPYLPDLAALEWAWHEVYHEADAVPLRPEAAQAPGSATPGLASGAGSSGTPGRLALPVLGAGRRTRASSTQASSCRSPTAACRRCCCAAPWRSNSCCCQGANTPGWRRLRRAARWPRRPWLPWIATRVSILRARSGGTWHWVRLPLSRRLRRDTPRAGGRGRPGHRTAGHAATRRARLRKPANCRRRQRPGGGRSRPLRPGDPRPDAAAPGRLADLPPPARRRTPHTR